MVDVFVSYKAEDRRRVLPLVRALEADGLSVWWDAHIGGGVDWRESIQEHLDGAKCVIVVWSKRSVAREGRFVRDEASRAQRHQTYLPVRIDKVDPPLGFGETQAIPLAGWNGDRSDERYLAVLEAVKAILAGKHYAQQERVSASHKVNRRTALVGAGAAAIAAAGGWLFLKSSAARASNSIAVLPFANLSGDPAQSYFSDGIAEELRSALARIPKMKVMARTSSEKVRDDDIQTAATKLDVDHILTGSVRKSPSTIRISTQLVDGKTGLEQWSEAYDRPAGDVLDVQTDIAAKVASALSLRLGGAAETLIAGRTRNPAAQDLFLKAKASWLDNPSADRFRAAFDLFDQAIELDPNFAEARAQKAIAMLVFVQTFASGKADYDQQVAEADSEAKAALKIAPDLQSGNVALAMSRAARLDFKGALAGYRRAFPDDSPITDNIAEYSRFLSQVGLTSDGAELADRGISADPLNPRAHQSKVWAFYCAHRYPETVEAARELLRWAPNRQTTLSRLGDSLLIMGKLDEAQAVYAQCQPEYPARLVGEAMLAARAGNRAASDTALAKLSQLYGETAGYRIAGVHAQRGEKDLAIAALARAIAVQDSGVTTLPTDPFIDPVREDPRFGRLTSKLDFPR